MAELVQGDRPIGVETPLGQDTLVLTAFAGEERISGLFSFDLQFLSEKGDIKPDQIVGENIDFYVRFPDGEPRYFNGHVNRFAYMGQGDRAHIYRATVVPWMWFLTKGADCKVHETGTQQNAQDIIDGLLSGLGFSDYKWDLKRTPEKRDYCVQYRETHYEFIARLLAEEGIYFYFKHEQGKHELVMTDHVGGVFDCQDGEVQLLSNLAQPELTDNLSSWSHDYEFTTGKFAHTDYNFETPSTALLVTKDTLVSLPDIKKNEVYDFPGAYLDKGLGDSLAQLRLEAEEANFDTVTGSSECRSFSPGGRFEVKEHHNDGEAGGKWVLTAVQHTADQGGQYFSGGAHSDDIYKNNFKCIPAATVFRPPFRPKPRVHGIQSAVVVGPPGDEIYTDEYGRIKVQFQWDRLGGKDDKSSFWVRVMTPWAGANWGMVHIPRIGHEVIIDFLDGDPDRPVMTGMVYNKENMPPYGLPANMTQSGIKSRSSKGGGAANFNEIRFEDKMGSEEVYIHAEKDKNEVVENDHTVSVGHDETMDVGNDRTRTVGHDETVTVQNNRTRTVVSNESVTVGKMRTHTVGINEAITVGATQEVTIGAAQAITVGANQATNVGNNQSSEVGKDQSVEVGDNQTTQIGKDQSIKIGDNQTIQIGKKLSINVGDEISIVTGKAKLIMKKDGTIQISGKDISVDAKGKINIKAAKDIVMKGKKILQN